MGRGWQQCACCATVRNQNSRDYPKGFPGGFMELERPIPPYATNLKQGDDISYKGYLMIKNRDLMGYNADEWIDIWNWSTFQPLAQVVQNSQWSQQHFVWTSNQQFLNFKQQALGLLMTTENIFQSPIHGKISCCLMPCSTLEHAHVAGHKIRVATLSWKYLARLGEIHIH